MRIHYLQHVSFENLGNIENWAINKGFLISNTKLYENETLPSLESFDFLVILGGPMNIYEENKYPWLVEEKEFIKKSIKNNKVVLGICLGAQLIADILGAKVFKNNEKEIGWFPIKFSNEVQKTGSLQGFPDELNVIHWHGDTFDIPKDSLAIASSEACKNQGFIYQNKVIGLQFHLETSEDSLNKLIDNCKNEILEAKYIQTPEYMLSNKENFRILDKNLNIFLDNLIKIYQ